MNLKNILPLILGLGFSMSALGQSIVFGGTYCPESQCIVGTEELGTKLFLVSSETTKVCSGIVKKNFQVADVEHGMKPFEASALSVDKSCGKKYSVAMKENKKKIEPFKIEKVINQKTSDRITKAFDSSKELKAASALLKQEPKSPYILHSLKNKKNTEKQSYLAEIKTAHGDSLFFYLRKDSVCQITERPVQQNSLGAFKMGDKVLFFGANTCLEGGCGDAPEFVFDLHECKVLVSDCSTCT